MREQNQLIKSNQRKEDYSWKAAVHNDKQEARRNTEKYRAKQDELNRELRESIASMTNEIATTKTDVQKQTAKLKRDAQFAKIERKIFEDGLNKPESLPLMSLMNKEGNSTKYYHQWENSGFFKNTIKGKAIDLGFNKQTGALITMQEIRDFAKLKAISPEKLLLMKGYLKGDEHGNIIPR